MAHRARPAGGRARGDAGRRAAAHERRGDDHGVDHRDRGDGGSVRDVEHGRGVRAGDDERYLLHGALPDGDAGLERLPHERRHDGVAILGEALQQAADAAAVGGFAGEGVMQRVTRALALMLVALALLVTPAAAQWIGMPGGGSPTLRMFGGGGAVSISGGTCGTTNAVAYFSDGTTLTCDADLTFDGTDVTLGSGQHLGPVSATPAYSFTGDADTGVGSAAANTLDFRTAGVRSWRIGSTGSLVGGNATDDMFTATTASSDVIVTCGKVWIGNCFINAPANTLNMGVAGSYPLVVAAGVVRPLTDGLAT